MTTNDQLDPRTLAAEFDALKERLDTFIEAADPSDENLHLAAFRKLDRHSFEALTQLAAEGRERVENSREFFLERDLYATGGFWYDLFLVISHAAQSYQSSAGEPLEGPSLQELVTHLVRISEYTASVPSDIRKRNQEALGDVLLNANDEGLRDLAVAEAKELSKADVVAFVEETITKVREVEGSTDESGD